MQTMMKHGASQHSTLRYAQRALPVAPVPHTERPDCRILRATTARALDRPACFPELVAAMIASAAVPGKLSAASCAAVRSPQT